MLYCTINFDSISVFQAGELLKGNIELHLDEPRKIRAFWINIYGTARCFWTKQEERYVGTGEHRRLESYTVNCEGKEVYLNQKHLLFGNEHANAVQIARGTHTYGFECLLPAELPASLRLPLGTISYEIEAILDIPWSFDKEFRREFIVVRNDDFRNQPELMIPSKSEEVKIFCCLFCESKPLIMSVMLPKTGFLPGQIIPITIDYVNKSDVKISTTEILLKQVIKYNCQTPANSEKCEKENIVEHQADGVEMQTNNKIDVALELPAKLFPTNSNHSKVIEIKYSLDVSAVSDGFHMNVDFNIPITIGSTPSSENYIFGNVAIPSETIYNLNVKSFPTDFKNLPPPSFEETMAAMKPLLNSDQFSNGSNRQIGWSGPFVPGYPPTSQVPVYPSVPGTGYPPDPAGQGYPPAFPSNPAAFPPYPPISSGYPLNPTKPEDSTAPSAPPE